MTVTQLITSIKFEGKANATTEFDAWLTDTINEEYLLLHQKHNYDQHIKDVTLSCTAATQSIALPSDFLRLPSNSRLKFYNSSNSSSYRLLTLASELQRKLTVGAPQWYQIKTDKIFLFPFTLVLSSDRIDLNYYKSPTTLVGGSTVPDIFGNILKHKVLARLLVYKDSKAAGFFTKQAEEKFTESV